MIRLYPSHADTWVPCPASAGLRQQYARPRTPAAEDGILAHKAAADLLTGQGPGVAPQGYEQAVNWYVQAVMKCCLGRRPIVEQKYDINEACSAKIDAYIYDSAANILHIWDLKTGFGIVEAIDNWQMLLYAVALLPQIRYGNVWLHIVQPRVWHEDGYDRVWRLTRQEVSSASVMLNASMNAALDTPAPMSTGPHCTKCDAILDCPAAIAASMNAVDVSLTEWQLNPNPYRLAREYETLTRAADMIKHRLSAIEQQGLAAGGLPGYEIGHGRGSFSWDEGKEEDARALGALLGVVLSKPGMITPTQAIEAGMPEEVVKQYATRHPGGKKLIKMRENTRIKEMFKNA